LSSLSYSIFFFSSRRRHTLFSRDWSSDVCSSDLIRLLSVFDVTRFAEFRDYVMTVLMLDTGMRCSEASFLLLDDINLKGYSIYIDRKSTRLNSSHVKISYAVFCLKKKKQKQTQES